MNGLVLPPLMSSEPAIDDPVDQACMRAMQGCDPGLVVYRIGPARLEAAIVYTPEIPLAQAMTMLPLSGVGFQNALGALAPPEVAVHLGWDGDIFVNGAKCGRLRAIAPETDPSAEPPWLIIGLELDLLDDAARPGDTPDRTALFAEGCADVSPPHLLESWARHTMNWIRRWEEDGTKPLHAEWRGLVRDMGEIVTQGDLTGTFLGTDEDFGMLIRDQETTHVAPLTTLLEDMS